MEFLLRMEGHAQQLGGTTGYLTTVDTLDIQRPTQVATHRRRAERHAIRTRLGGIERLAIDVIVLLDGTPVVGIDELQGVCRAVLVTDYELAIGYAALHVIGRTGQEQIGARCPTLQRNGDSIRIVIPQRGIDDVTSLGWCTERHARHHEMAILDAGTEDGVVDLGRLLGMTPLANALHGNL